MVSWDSNISCTWGEKVYLRVFHGMYMDVQGRQAKRCMRIGGLLKPRLFHPHKTAFNKHAYPLVNIQKTMEHHHFQWVNPLFLWPIFNSYVKITRGYIRAESLQVDCSWADKGLWQAAAESGKFYGQSLSLPIGSMVLVYMLTLGVDWW